MSNDKQNHYPHNFRENKLLFELNIVTNKGYEIFKKKDIMNVNEQIHLQTYAPEWMILFKDEEALIKAERPPDACSSIY